MCHFVLGVRFHGIVAEETVDLCIMQCKCEDSGICGAFLRGVWILPLVMTEG